MAFRWDRVTDRRLLETPLASLPVAIRGTWLEEAMERLYGELASRRIRCRPQAWLARDWFSPDGVPGIAIPFYLAHPRLMKLEQKFMLEVEGGTEGELMRILRHEAGHALDTAFRLHFRRRWRELFGSFTQRYPTYYRPRPNSRQFVLHLRGWYAQAHPAEDFAETFAVWLRPSSHWRRRYQGWPALRKLEYVDDLMREIAGTPSPNRKRGRVEPISECHETLGAYYDRKREEYSLEWPAYYDRGLRRMFSEDPRHASRESAAMFLRRTRRSLCTAVAEGTGVHPYTLNHMIEHMKERCKALNLRCGASKAQTFERALVVLTFEAMNMIHSGYYKLAI